MGTYMFGECIDGLNDLGVWDSIPVSPPPPQSVTWGNVEPWEVCQIWIWANLDLGALVRSLILPLSGYTYVSSSLWPGVLPLTMILIGLPPWLVQLPFKILVKVWFYFLLFSVLGLLRQNLTSQLRLSPDSLWSPGWQWTYSPSFVFPYWVLGLWVWVVMSRNEDMTWWG